MRELTFRAWDKRDSTMRTLFLLNSKGVPLEVGFVEPEIREPNELILMQYTGLKDCRGREIYEGDVVRARRWEPLQTGYFQGIVGYEPQVACFVIACVPMSHVLASSMEVLGNVYENRELIAGKGSTA